MRDAFLACALAVLAGCTPLTWPRVVSTADIRARPTTRGDWIASDEEALASIRAIMTRDLGLPDVRAAVYFHRDRDAFRAALEAEGYEPSFARDTAEALSAVSGHQRVIVNDGAMRDLAWPIRIGLLAHELTHTLQYEFSGGTRGTSEQWLREGFAEWVEVEVLVRLDLTTRATARVIALNRLRGAGVRALPLAEMVTFPHWVALAQRLGQEPIYAHAFLAAEFLLRRHGVPAALEYFRLFAASDDRLANFRRAFGEDLPAFDAAFQEYLAATLR